jgi:Tfp pilus assembly protein PilF
MLGDWDKEGLPGNVAGSSGQAAATPSQRWRLWSALTLGVVVILGLAWGAWHFRNSPTADELLPPEPSAAVVPDPRETYSGPFHNIRPGVRYVGDAACAKCHRDIAEKYRHHPMAHSFAPVGAVAGSQVYDAGHHNPFEALGAQFSVERRGDQVVHRQAWLGEDGKPICQQDSAVQYVMGSGTRGRSYVTSHDGYLFQTAISWFTQKQVWDMSPGFAERHISKRPISAECMFCHVNQADYLEGSINHFNPASIDGQGIGCERCHGPGSRHVRSSDPKDIVNPRRLEPSLREAVCQQCHLEGIIRVPHRGRQLSDFRPGLPLDAVWSIFVPTGELADEEKSVSQVEQLSESTCFHRSAGPKQLGCVSCHDPHQPVAGAARASFYRERCLKCHEPGSCHASQETRQAKADSCIDCHMPRFQPKDVAHTAVTDHRILRRPDTQSKPSHKRSYRAPAEQGLPLARFSLDGKATSSPENARDLGVALAVLMSQGTINPERYDSRALRLLEEATRRAPLDAAAWQALGHVQLLRKEPWKALTALEAALKAEPNLETALTGAAALSQALPDPPRALDYWRRAVAANPWMPEYRASFAPFLADLGHWKEAREQNEAWLRLEPASVPARLLHIRCLLQDNRRDEAELEFRRIVALRPPSLDALRTWFARQTAGAVSPDLPPPSKARPAK